MQFRVWNLWESGKRDESPRCTVSFSFCFIFPSGCANKNGVCRVLRGETKLRMNGTCLHAGSLPLPLLRRRLSTAFIEKRDTFSSFPRGSRLVSSSPDFLVSKYRSHFHVESSLFHFPTFTRLRLEEWKRLETGNLEIFKSLKGFVKFRGVSLQRNFLSNYSFSLKT